MKTCPNCHASLSDDAIFCTNCGTNLAAAPVPPAQPETQIQKPEAQMQPQQPVYQQAPPQQPVPPMPEPQPTPFDHTAEFSEEEVHDNKIFALSVYALSFIGIIIALLAKSSDNSAYLRFHIKQQLMILISEVLIGVITAVLCWTCIVPIAAAGLLASLEIVEIICFINVCRNKSIEPLLIRRLGFLK